MKTLKLKDNTSYKSEDSEELYKQIEESSVLRSLQGTTLNDLSRQDDNFLIFPPDNARNNEAGIEKNAVIIEQKRNGDYWTHNVMGVIGDGNETVIIKSRFGSEKNNYFEEYLITKALGWPSLTNRKVDAESKSNMLDILSFMLPYYLKRALRKGMYKNYVWKKYNDSNVKGVVDIARHIRQNVPFTGRIAYNKREFAYDNYLTELVRHAIEYIKTSKKIWPVVKAMAGDEIRQIVDVTASYTRNDRSKIITENDRHPVRHAFYREYRDLQKLCLLILKHSKHGIGEGSKKIYGILFDGSWLWEEYLYKLIHTGFYHPRNKGRSSIEKQYLFCCFDDNTQKKEKEQNIIPDFIGKDEDDVIIADAKYKPSGNIRRSDYYQVLAYMLRFGAKKGYFLYPKDPEDEASKDQKLYLLKGLKMDGLPYQDIYVQKLGLVIPDETDYATFEKSMNKEEDSFKTKLGL